MKQEHKYAQALRWIADGYLDKMHIRWGTNLTWMNLRERSDIVFGEMAIGFGSYEFRLAPRTITINGREIEAPLSEAPEIGTIVWWTDSIGVTYGIRFTINTDSEKALRTGRLFATEEAAKAAHDAITSLMTGKG